MIELPEISKDHQRYILDNDYRPVVCEDEVLWREFMSKPDNVLVAKDSVGKFKLITVFLGFNCFNVEQPIFFQTSFSGVDEHSHGNAATWQEAMANHKTLFQSAMRLAAREDKIAQGIKPNSFTFVDIQVFDNEIHFILESEESAKKALSTSHKHWKRQGKALVFMVDK